ncbi:MAG: hypothetical protein ACTFAL_07760 [Candidatus Electronema sp. V4]|uniref:hypothetical protein n=1 Tax=Candidatus Electronema sp. V4 TaxID=3454756 RepID=UPI004055818B
MSGHSHSFKKIPPPDCPLGKTAGMLQFVPTARHHCHSDAAISGIDCHRFMAMSSACISAVIILRAVDTQQVPDQRISPATTLRMGSSGCAGLLTLSNLQQEKIEMPVRYLCRGFFGTRDKMASGFPCIGHFIYIPVEINLSRNINEMAHNAKGAAAGRSFGISKNDGLKRRPAQAGGGAAVPSKAKAK